MSSATAFRVGLLVLLCAIVLAVAGWYEWSQTKTCGGTAPATCVSGKHLHPMRAELLWGAAAIAAIVGAGLMVRSRGSSRDA